MNEKNPRAVFAQIALAEARKIIRETEGSNRGPGISKYWDATTYRDGYRDRQPYCCAAVCWMIAEAKRTGVPWASGLPTTPSVSSFKNWALREQANGDATVFRFDDPRLHPERGDIICFLPVFSHIGVVVDMDKSAILTVEANTTPDASTPAKERDGGGVYSRRRNLNAKYTFIRLRTKGEVS